MPDVPAMRRSVTWNRWSGVLFVAPYCAFFVLMLLIPLGIGIRLSMTRGDLFGIEAFVGLDNFARLFADPVFLQAVWNTFCFVLITVPAMTVIGLALALVLNRTSRLAAILRAIFFASTVLSVTVVALIWRLMLIPEGGLAAVLAWAIGEQPVAFLSEQALALPAVAVTTIWWGIGLPMVLFLAALQQIPRDLYEAAALDRAPAQLRRQHRRPRARVCLHPGTRCRGPARGQRRRRPGGELPEGASRGDVRHPLRPPL